MINLLPYRQKKMIDRIKVMRIINATVLSLILLTFVGALLYMPSLFTINSRYEVAQEQIVRLEKEGVLTNAADISAYEDRVNALIAKLAAPLTTSPTARLASIRTAASPGITLSGFALDVATKPVVVVHGTATTRETLQRFVEVLQKEKDIQSVDSPITNYVKSTNTDFTITITFKA